MTEPIVPDPALIRTAAERDAVNQRILDDLADDHAQTGVTLSGPFYPEAMGAVLGKLFAAEPTPGPPWVPTIEPPRCDLEDCCATDGPCSCACHRIQPTHTITNVEFTSEPYGEPQPGEPRHAVPETGRYQVEKRLTE